MQSCRYRGFLSGFLNIDLGYNISALILPHLTVGEKFKMKSRATSKSCLNISTSPMEPTMKKCTMKFGGIYFHLKTNETSESSFLKICSKSSLTPLEVNNFVKASFHVKKAKIFCPNASLVTAFAVTLQVQL